jgi:hypothetical protein
VVIRLAALGRHLSRVGHHLLSQIARRDHGTLTGYQEGLIDRLRMPGMHAMGGTGPSMTHTSIRFFRTTAGLAVTADEVGRVSLR